MKTSFLTLYGLTAILLVGLTTFVSAQDAEAQRRMIEAQRAMMRSPAMQQSQRNAAKQMMNTFWNGDGSHMLTLNLLQQNNDFREGIGVSQEQTQKFQKAMRDISMSLVDDPTVKPFRDEMEKLTADMPGGPFGEGVSEETQQRFFEIQADMTMKMMEMMGEKMANFVNENLTPDQMKKVREFQISTMGEIPIISPNMFEALDLSDAQREQLNGIKKELEPEFGKHVDKMIDMQMKHTEKFQDAMMERLDGVTDDEERRRIIESIDREIRQSHPEIQREMDEVMESGKGFANRLKFRMIDVLTDEQMELLAELVDNPPDYVKKIIAQIRKQMGEDDSPGGASGEWRPGPNSWKPGDPIPEEYRQQREERRFPRR